jgi:hypothetical protein
MMEIIKIDSGLVHLSKPEKSIVNIRKAAGIIVIPNHWTLSQKIFAPRSVHKYSTTCPNE